MKDHERGHAVVDSAGLDASADLAELLAAPIDAGTRTPSADDERIDGIVTGTLVGFSGDGVVPLVTHRKQRGTGAVPARSLVDLQASHIGSQTVLMFEDGDRRRPIILGCLKSNNAALPRSEQVHVDADGHRLVVSATDRIVLRCGKASITLTKEGKVVIQGAYVSNQSSGVLRLKGGSVQIN